MRWLDGITDSMDMSLSELWEKVSEGQGSLECCSPWGHKGSDTTERLSNNKPPVGRGKALGGRRRPCRNAWTLCAQCPVYALGVRWVS